MYKKYCKKKGKEFYTSFTPNIDHIYTSFTPNIENKGGVGVGVGVEWGWGVHPLPILHGRALTDHAFVVHAPTSDTLHWLQIPGKTSSLKSWQTVSFPLHFYNSQERTKVKKDSSLWESFLVASDVQNSSRQSPATYSLDWATVGNTHVMSVPCCAQD